MLLTRHKVVLGLLAVSMTLGACSPSTPAAEDAQPQSHAAQGEALRNEQEPRDQRQSGAGTAGSKTSSTIDRTPHAADWKLPEFDRTGTQIPQTYEEARILAPAWVTRIEEKDGVYLAADEDADRLRYMAVTSVGEILWAAERPKEATGFALSKTEEGTNVAALTDIDDPEFPGELSVTGYNLETGETLWGPVQAPGPHTGPGLTFTGEDGNVVLDPTTGKVAGPFQGEVLGEYQGTVITATETGLSVETLGTATTWDVKTEGTGLEVKAADYRRPLGDFALLDTADGAGPLLNLAQQKLVAPNVRDFAHDYLLNVTAFVDSSGIRAVSPEGDGTWQIPADSQTTIEALGGLLLYLRQGDVLQANNALTGEVAQAYAPDQSGRIVVPWYMSGDGSAILIDGYTPLLATVEARAQDISG